MIVAMMLPTQLPLLVVFAGFVAAPPAAACWWALLVAGYLVTWTAFGVAAWTGRPGHPRRRSTRCRGSRPTRS